MNKVEPIRDQKKIEEIKAYLKNWNEKYYMMWLLGSNIGLRVSDIMKIKVDDIAGKDHLLFRDEKTNKEHRLPVNRHLRREIADYFEKEQLKPDDYIIPSQKGISPLAERDKKNFTPMAHLYKTVLYTGLPGTRAVFLSDIVNASNRYIFRISL